MTKDSIEKLSNEKATLALAKMITNAGLTLSTMERLLCLNVCAALYLDGIVLGIKESQSTIMKGGENKDAKS